MPPKAAETTPAVSSADTGGFQLPWTAIPKFNPGVTDVTEYSSKLQFLAAMWPREHLPLLAPRAALLCEGTAFKKVAKIPAEKLKSTDDSGIQLLVSTLGGSWGKTALEEKYDIFEKAMYGTTQKADETNDSYLARHDVHFEELLAQGVTLEEVRAYILLRQSQLTAEDRKKIVVEMGGKLEYAKVCSAIRLLGSRFFSDLQGQRTVKTKTYDANATEEVPPEEPERAFQASSTGAFEDVEPELDVEYLEAMVAAEDPDAVQVQGFEEELEGFFQETPDLQEALVTYLEARQKLLAKKRSRGFWPVSSGKGGFKGSKGSKGRGKGGKGGRDQLLARIARSHCRICGAKGHWKAECPQKSKAPMQHEATTTVAEVLTGDSYTVATDQSEADEILTQVPTSAMSLAEAFITWNPLDKQRVLDRLSKMVAQLRKPKKALAPYPRPMQRGATSLTELSHGPRDPKTPVCQDDPAHALFSAVATDAILDTGASRCVMGKSLVKGFLNQLSETVRAQVKIMKSSVRFRFGNNQTLLSDRRVLMPFQTASRRVLWLSIEVVPGSTPLLFSKKAIKQLGGLIDTETDMCHLRRLQKSVHMRVGPTGLYLIDLARLCEESNLTSESLSVCEDDGQKAPLQDLCMNVTPAPLRRETHGCTAGQGFSRGLKVWNSGCRSFPKQADVNVSLQKPEGLSVCPVKSVKSDQEVNPAAEIVNSQAQQQSVPELPSNPKKGHGPEAPSNSASGSVQHSRACTDCELPSCDCRVEPGCPLQPTAGSVNRLHFGGGGNDAAGPARTDPNSVRKGHEGTDVRGHRPKRSFLGAVDARSHVHQHEDGACGLPHLRPSLHRGGRGRRSSFVEHGGSIRFQRLGSQAGPKESPEATSRGRCLGRDPFKRRARSFSSGASDGARRAPGTDGVPHATDDSAPQSELSACLGEVWKCQRELEALVAQTKIPVQELELKAKELLENEATLTQLKNFLKSVPWHLLSPQGPRMRECVKAGEVPPRSDQKTPAYIMFGMFVHGGITGITKASKAYPYITRVLTKVIQQVNPQHPFTTVGVSMNNLAQPHKDSYNSREIPNLIVPLEYPTAGGEIWTAQPPRAQQVALDRQCGNAVQPGSLKPLKPGMSLDPHIWHASQPWQGNRLLAIAFSLKPVEKLGKTEVAWLKVHGFHMPSCISSPKGVHFRRTSNQPQHAQNADSQLVESPEQASTPVSALRQELQDAKAFLMPSQVHSSAANVADACADAFAKAEKTAWDVFQDSQLAYQRPVAGEQLDVLEVYAAEDSRITQEVRALGGKARRFTCKDGDLRSVEGQRCLWDILQETQPKHVWMSPSCRAWCSWNALNASRGNLQASRVQRMRQEDVAHLQLCTQVFQWQVDRNRHFHFEQPAQSKMLDSPIISPVVQGSHKVFVDMCAFGLCTPASKIAIRKRTCLLSTCPSLVRSLAQKQCPGHSFHQPISGRLRQLGGLSTAQYAGSYCQGFAQHVAQKLMSLVSESSLAANEVIPMTRKRQKTSLGIAAPIIRFGAQKRHSDVSEEGQQRSQAQPRVTNPVSASETRLLLEGEWKLIFDQVQGLTSKVTPSLVSPRSPIIEMMQKQLPEFQILQVFIGRGGRQLHWPLGSLPQTVAPWRISICQRTRSDGQLEYACVGQELRSTVEGSQRRRHVGTVDYLITVFAQKQEAENPQAKDPVSAGVPEPETANGQNLEGWAPPPTPLHGPAFRSLDKESKATLIRIHKNLGHPSPMVLSQHLKAAGQEPAMIEAALDYQCDTCLESSEPRHQRPSKLPEPREFNDLVGVDGFFFKGQSGYRAYVIHVLDESSCFHQGRRTQSRHSAEAMQALGDCWFSWAGNPHKVYLDPAGEFRSEQILEQLQGLSIKAFVTAAAWQRGRIERHGDIAKEMLARLDNETPLVNDVAFDRALTQVFQAKNALVRHLGYSPEQIVLGKSVQVPGSLTSDEGLSSHTLALGEELESERHRQRLELRCAARKAFFEADNSQAIRRAVLRRSTPARGPFLAGSWVLYWTKKSSPNRLAAGRWHGPAKVICQEGQSIVWIAHGTTILRRAPENLRPASLREWQQLTSQALTEAPSRVGGASSYVDLTGVESSPSPTHEPVRPSSSVDMPLPTNPGTNNVSAARVSQLPDDDLGQPEQELTPQVSVNESESRDPSRAPEVERGAAAPSTFEPISGQETPALSEIPAPSSVDASQVPVPDSEEGLYGEHVLLASEAVTGNPDVEPELLTFTTLHVSESSEGPPLAEDNLPYVESPLECAEGQAFCVEIPLKPRDVQKWAQESSPEQLATLATVGKRARVEVRVKDLSREEVALFDQAKQKELQCWIQTSAIKNILRSKLNPSQILKSRWILTWKAPEPGETKKRAKARLVVLGFQDPKLVEVMRDAPTLSREGRATVLQTIASCRFPLSSFDIKTAFLRGKADEGNPLAMEPPPELRKLLNLPESEVCQLVGNAYGRVDAPLLFYKELCKQLKLLGFTVHPLEPCVFLLKTGSRLHGILGVHVDDGVCGGDEHFLQKIESLQKILPFGSRKHQSFIFTGIQLEQLPDYSIRASQSEYVHRIPQIDIGRNRRQFPEAAVNEEERTKLRGLIGSVQYAVTHTRPDIAARLGELQCQTTTATVQTLLLANKVLREAQEHHQVCIFFQSIPVERLTFVAFGDASFASSKNLNSHQGVLICATNDQLNQNLEAPISPLTWSSKKIPRVVRSTLSAEAYAMSKAVDLLGWVRALWGVIHVPEFQWQKPESGFRQLRTAIIVTDCKSLFDLVTRLAMPACEEYRTTLEVLLIKQRCLENACFRWVPTTLQAADSLTKAMDSSLLRAVLARGRFKLYDSSQTLEKDAQRKQAIQWLQSPPTS